MKLEMNEHGNHFMFGMYKGKKLYYAPVDYLSWVLRTMELSPMETVAIKTEIERKETVIRRENYINSASEQSHEEALQDMDLGRAFQGPSFS